MSFKYSFCRINTHFNWHKSFIPIFPCVKQCKLYCLPIFLYFFFQSRLYFTYINCGEKHIPSILSDQICSLTVFSDLMCWVSFYGNIFYRLVMNLCEWSVYNENTTSQEILVIIKISRIITATRLNSTDQSIVHAIVPPFQRQYTVSTLHTFYGCK